MGISSIITDLLERFCIFFLLSFNPGYIEAMTFRDQKNFVASVLYLPPTANFPEGLIVTGGNDNTILIYKPSEPFAIYSAKEHTNTGMCLKYCCFDIFLIRNENDGSIVSLFTMFSTNVKTTLFSVLFITRFRTEYILEWFMGYNN